ncbi:MAG: DegV family protein [Firmicutes bacterium]|nr:DegV family protein [Bacillota bacterium]
MKIVADSCCDITSQEEKEFDIKLVPLTLYLGEESFVDDDTLDLEDFKEKMALYKDCSRSACPSPGEYKQAFLNNGQTFCITLSSNLSGSYNSAVLAKEMAEEEGEQVEVIDSKSAAAAEALLAYEIVDQIKAGLSYEEIKDYILEFVKNMKTYFVLENLDNLMKNGRLNKVAGKIITALHVSPIMGADGDGNIKLYNYGRTKKQILQKMVNMVKECKQAGETFKLVIAHNNNSEMAESLQSALNEVFNSIVIKLVPTRGISSMYADNKGLIIAF